MCLFLQGIYVIRGSYTCTDTKDDLQEEGQEEVCCRPNITSKISPVHLTVEFEIVVFSFW